MVSESFLEYLYFISYLNVADDMIEANLLILTTYKGTLTNFLSLVIS